MSLRRVWVILLAGGFVAAVTAADNQPIPGIGPVGDIVKAKTGFRFTEGPAVDEQGNVYFTDIPTNRILKITPEGSLSTFLENSQGCNGLMFDGRGRLIACQGNAGRVIAIDVRTKDIEVLASQYNGKRFNRPNDLVVDRFGGVYFTDPLFGPGEQTQDKMAVYYISPQKQVRRLIGDLPRPNGVILSPDERTLYVLPSGTPDVMAYPIQSPGRLGRGRVLCRLQQPPGRRPRGGDGLTIDTKGNLYLTNPAMSAIQVVTPEGKTLGLITFPEAPANVCFGGKDMKTLYVTARTSLYTVRMEATGHRFGKSRG